MNHHCIRKLFTDTFQSLELCNENILHNKVPVSTQTKDIVGIRIIPKGRKCFLWFYEYHTQMYCFCVEIQSKYKTIQHISMKNIEVTPDLGCGTYGTLLYGTIGKHPSSSSQETFCIEDVLYYMSCNVSSKNWVFKYNLFSHLFSLLNHLNGERTQTQTQTQTQTSTRPHNIDTNENEVKHPITLVLPITYNLMKEYSAIFEECRNKDISMYSCQYLMRGGELMTYVLKEKDYVPLHLETHTAQRQGTYISNTTRQPTANLLIKARVDNDIYDVYCLDEKSNLTFSPASTDKNIHLKYLGNANIHDYKTSVFMNAIYRNVRENKDLDAIEESDDEDEFQNIQTDKNVYLDKQCIFQCILSEKYKTWMPIKFISEPAIDDDTNVKTSHKTSVKTLKKEYLNVSSFREIQKYMCDNDSRNLNKHTYSKNTYNNNTYNNNTYNKNNRYTHSHTHASHNGNRQHNKEYTKPTHNLQKQRNNYKVSDTYKKRKISS